MTTATSGKCKIIVQDERILKSIDSVSDGAASSFLSTVRPTLEAVMTSAQSRWPVRTGTSKAAFQIVEEASETTVKASIYNPASIARWGFYAYKVKYSAWTAADITTAIEEAAAKGTTPAAQAAIRRYTAIKLKLRHGRGAPDEASQGKNVWTLLVRAPVKAGLAPLLPKLQADLMKLTKV